MIKKRPNRKSQPLGDTVKYCRRTLIASAAIVHSVCTLCTFVELCKKKKDKGPARVFTFFGCLSALAGLAFLCSEKYESDKIIDNESDAPVSDRQSDAADSPTFFSTARFSKTKKSVTELFTDASAFAKNDSGTKNSCAKISKKSGTNPPEPPSNVTVIIPESAHDAEKSAEEQRIARERIERERAEKALAEKERIEREEAAERKREAERREAQNRLDEAIRILKNAAKGAPEDESENSLEKTLADHVDSLPADSADLSEALQDGETK